MKSFWNERYSHKEYVYGEKPNEYLKEKLHDIPEGKILFPADGEGRNSVYMASLGWDTYAFDQSEQAREKAFQLAEKNGVSINYEVATVEEIDCDEKSFNVLALIYTHFPEEKRREYHQKLSGYLKLNGVLLLEGFSKDHVQNQQENPSAGGPKEVGKLYDMEELKADFPDFDFIEAYQTDTFLEEGENHKGKASIIRILAIRKIQLKKNLGKLDKVLRVIVSILLLLGLVTKELEHPSASIWVFFVLFAMLALLLPVYIGYSPIYNWWKVHTNKR